MTRISTIASFGLTTSSVLLASSVAFAGNDISLHRFVECASFTQVDADTRYCNGVTADEENFRLFARDLGLAMTAHGVHAPDTLGQAGFAVQVNHQIATIDPEAEHWQLADLDGQPTPDLHSTWLHVAKGLPFSMEIGGNIGMLWQSELMSIGGEMTWAFHEDTAYPVPDIAIRGSGNILVGQSDLQLYNIGAQAMVGLPVPINGTFSITPWAGYSAGIISSGSRVLDATPDDPTPAIRAVGEPTDPGHIPGNSPEWVFGTETQLFNQALIGVRFRITSFNITAESRIGGDIATVSFGVGSEF